MLITMLNRNKIKTKQTPILIALFFMALFIASCKTCKCPAYSETPPTNEHVPQIQTTEFAVLQPVEKAYLF